jgi:hypothetical protein
MIHALVYIGLVSVFLQSVYPQTCEVKASTQISVAASTDSLTTVTARTPDKLRYKKTVSIGTLKKFQWNALNKAVKQAHEECAKWMLEDARSRLGKEVIPSNAGLTNPAPISEMRNPDEKDTCLHSAAYDAGYQLGLEEAVCEARLFGGFGRPLARHNSETDVRPQNRHS